MRWLIALKRKDLDKTAAAYRHRSLRVCDEHFEESAFMNASRSRLTWNSVPTLFISNRTPPRVRAPPTLRQLPMPMTPPVENARDRVSVNSMKSLADHNYCLVSSHSTVSVAAVTATDEALRDCLIDVCIITAVVVELHIELIIMMSGPSTLPTVRRL